MTIATEEALLGGVPPQFVVDVSASGATYRSGGSASSAGELAAALHAAATYKSPVKVMLIATIVAAFLALNVEPYLLVVVAIAAMVLLPWAAARAAKRARVAVLYRLDSTASLSLEAVSDGVGWLANSRALWRITHEEPAQRPANTTSVTRVPARVSNGKTPHLLTNIAVPAIAAGGETVLFLPDALVTRDAAGRSSIVPYGSVRVELETMRFTESGTVPGDSRQVGHAWLYANKDGSPDRRRAHNHQLPVLEYGRAAISWRGSGCVLLVSHVEGARHFVHGLQAATQPQTKPRQTTVSVAPSPQPAVVPVTATPAQTTPAPTELERVLQASIARKLRLEELERQAATVVARHERNARGENRPPPARSNAEWLAEGRSVTVHGFATGPFVYVGSNLAALDGSRIEPALIDPTLPVDPSHANASGAGMTYWPSYSTISAASRRAYLQWLAGGRTDPNAYVGYVFIFFYGLERRVYECIQRRGSNADEVLAIGQEVARLLDLYGGNSNSFTSYADSFLDLIASIEPRARDLRGTPVQPAGEVPHRLKLALGELALQGKAIPASMALDWVRSVSYLNTPATRCARELELLFHIRYVKQFGDGMVLKPNKRFLELTYRPASAGLEPVTIGDRKIPDVTQLARPVAKLSELARECSAALDSFSRFLGKNPEGRESLAAFALLPEELVEGTPSTDAQALAALVQSRLDGNGRAGLAAAELLQYVSLAKPGKVSKSEAMLLAQALEKLGYGIEPDVRLGGPVYDVDGRVVVFRRQADCPSVASDEYATAALLIRLAAIVSAADDAVSEAERTLLERHIEDRLRLTAGERQRIAAHLAWLLDADLGTAGLKRRIDSLPRDARKAIGALLVDVAATDGRVDPREMKVLEKLYELLDLPAADLYRDVHAAQSDDEPVVVDPPPANAKGFAIPPPSPATTAGGIDMDRVRLKIAETRQVSTLLSTIFVEEEAPPAAVAPAIAEAGTIGTLDAAHSELLRRLAERESWPREEIERLAAELSLLTDGALETLNDYAYAAASEPLWEDDDPVAINTSVARELVA